MAIVNLNSIFAKIRRLTGTGNDTQIPNFANPLNPNSVGLADYINSFYNYDFPAQFRSLKLKDTYTFNTIQGVDTYAFNSEQFTTLEMPCRVAKRDVQLFFDQWTFYGLYFNWQNFTNFTFSNGTAGPYAGNTTGSPLIRSVNNNPLNIGSASVPGVSQGNPGWPAARVQNILITANTLTGTLNVTDDGNGGLIGDCLAGGTINYQTGAINNLTFTQVIPQGNQIQIQYNPVKESIPLSILFYQNQFTLRPVPDQGYTVELTAYRQPTQALMNLGAGTGTPELSEWWECIAVGAAKKVYEDRLDTDGMMLMDKMLKERYDVCYTRTYAQLGSQRIATIFSDQNNYNNGSGFGFGSGSGV
ncbi:MAG TPA: hypothetical protein VIJ14_07980 [Rhabdochlamydiaceae bacterium]